MLFLLLLGLINSDSYTPSEHVYTNFGILSERVASFTANCGNLAFNFTFFVFTNFWKIKNLNYMMFLGPVFLTLYELNLAVPILLISFDDLGSRLAAKDLSTLSLLFANFSNILGKIVPLVAFLVLSSEHLPEGFESTGICLINGIHNLGVIIGDYWLVKEMKYFGVWEGHWGNLVKVVQLNSVVGITLTVLSPLFIGWG